MPNGNYLVELMTIVAVQVTLVATFVNLKKEFIVDFEILLQQLKQFVEKWVWKIYLYKNTLFVFFAKKYLKI